MSLEGLDYILNKREVVPTVSARDLLERPDQVESDYLRHVRTYVPISRSAGDDQSSVERFEQKVIRRIQNAGAPRGYLTGEYGYGKTSTALYLWQRAEAAGLLAVPPFQMTELSQLVDALHSWARYRLAARGGELLPELDALYQRATTRSVESYVTEGGGDVAAYRRWVQEGRLSLRLREADFLSYFEGVTQLTERAGLGGVLLMPDEIQQYFEPKVQAGREDPIAPLFNLIQALATREKRLRLGLIMVIPHKEIALIRDARGRGDLLQRMAETSLDLTAVYDRQFAARLWARLAEVFAFREIAGDIAPPEALAALGEIAARDDLSNGPRTVINAYKRMVERHRAGAPAYTPIDLVDDLLSGAIPFSGNNQIQAVARRALQDALVKGQPERERAIKLAAAFPDDGAPRDIQRAYGLDRAFDALMQDAIGRLVIHVGPIDREGVTLVGLEPGRKTTEWLPAIISDFRRVYGEGLNETKERALAVFTTLLRERVFRGWQLVDQSARTLTVDRLLVFEGAFPSAAGRFPQRRVRVTILWEDEARLDNATEEDVELEFRLRRYSDRDERRSVAEPLTLDDDAHRAVLPINLAYVLPGGIAPQIMSRLDSVWSPYQLTPLVLMSIYALLDEKRADNAIPRQDDHPIQGVFQPSLMDEISRDLLNAGLGAPLSRTGAPLIETIVNRLLEARYGNYRTLMPLGSWRDSLKKYDAALNGLESDYQRRGEADVEGTKNEIANKFVMSSTWLDSFMKSFGDLIVLVRPWPSQKAERDGATGAVRFTLHPEERRIVEQLRVSPQTQEALIAGHSVLVHVLNLGQVRAESLRRGYLGDEFDRLIHLLEQRGLVEVVQNRFLRELPSAQPDVAGLEGQLATLAADLEALDKGFGGNAQLRTLRQEVGQLRELLARQIQSGQPDADTLLKLGKAAAAKQRETQQFYEGQRSALQDRLRLIAAGLSRPRQAMARALSRRVDGTVAYAGQVEALRAAVQRQAEKADAALADVEGQLESARTTLGRADPSLVTLAAEARRMAQYEVAAADSRRKLDDVVAQFDQLARWRRLVADGDDLLGRLRELGPAAAEIEPTFHTLARDAQAAISSRPNKLDALPEFRLYETRLAELAAAAHQTRSQAQSDFTNRQQRYRQVLLRGDESARQPVAQPFEFNFSNPSESYRLLAAWVRDQVTQAIDQAQQTAARQRQEMLQVQQTPFLVELPTDERQRVSQQGEAALAELAAALGIIETLRKQADSGAVGRADDEAAFEAIVAELARLRQTLADNGARIRRLGHWLNEVALTPQEQAAYDRLGHGEAAEDDLASWRAATKLDDDAFWRVVRGLFEKRRIRIQVGQVGQ